MQKKGLTMKNNYQINKLMIKKEFKLPKKIKY